MLDRSVCEREKLKESERERDLERSIYKIHDFKT